MKTEDKFYTPKIEEFRVGFEYELSFIDEDRNYKNSWQKKTFELDGSWLNVHEDLEEELNCGRFRVKRLDREDIESLGFGDYKRAVCHWYKKEGRFEDAFATYGYWTKIRMIHCPDNYSVKIIAFEYSWDEEETVLFQGKIKNKSELRELLEKLGIE